MLTEPCPPERPDIDYMNGVLGRLAETRGVVSGTLAFLDWRDIGYYPLTVADGRITPPGEIELRLYELGRFLKDAASGAVEIAAISFRHAGQYNAIEAMGKVNGITDDAALWKVGSIGIYII